MLRAMPEEDRPIAAISPLFSDFEPEAVDVEVQHRFQVLHEQGDRSNLGDGKGLGGASPLPLVEQIFRGLGQVVRNRPIS